MAEFEQPWAFTPPEYAHRGIDGEYYWPDGQLMLTYGYSKLKKDDKRTKLEGGNWIVGYHTLGSRECKDENPIYFNSEHEARQYCYNNPKKYPQFA